MMPTRRDFLTLSAASAAALAFRPHRAFAHAQLEDTFYKWIEVAPNLFCGQVRTGDNMAVLGGNCALATHKDGALLVDTMQAVLGPSVRREALTRTSKFAQVINTHHHFDHAGGNHAFTADTKVFGHPKCRERLLKDFRSQVAQIDQKIAAIENLSIDGSKAAAADARAWKESLATLKPEAFAPTDTIEGDVKRDIAGRKVEIYHVGIGHTDNDLILFFPAENVLVTGDLVFNGYHSYYDASAKADSQGWQRSLRRCLELCSDKTKVIPGHGDVGGKEIVANQIAYFDRARAMVEKASKDGKTREEVVKMTIPETSDFKIKLAEGLVLGGIFDELKR